MEATVPVQTDTLKLGFIGAGKMAESIARGVVQYGVLPASRIRTAHLGSARRAAFESFGVNVLDHNNQVVEDSDVVIFSVKPQVVKDVILQLRPKLLEKQLLVSVVAGVKLKDLQEWAGHSRFIRVIPNTPAAVGKAASVMSLGAAATAEDGELIAKLFGAIGKIWKADEKLFDAITGLSGSGPAYIFLAIEALADGGVAAGLPRDLALGLASQTVLGAASMAATTGKHPGQLKDDVASPGGTTIAGIHELEKGGLRGIFMNAVVDAAAKRIIHEMLVDDIGDVTITNDGATILKMLEVEHPAAKVLVELAELQDREVGDGTTSVVIIAAELLKIENDLVRNKIHPTSIISGYRLAMREACKYMRKNWQ